PVNLQLGHVVDTLSIRQPLAAQIESAQLLEVITIVEREHWTAMYDLGETFGRLSANALGRAVRGYLIGMLLLEFLKLLEQGIVFRVGYLGIVLNVVEIFMTSNLFAQLFNLLTGSSTLFCQGLISS